MKEIKITTDWMGIATAKCPFGVDDTFGVLLVGSTMCRMCRYYRGLASDNKSVKCANDKK